MEALDHQDPGGDQEMSAPSSRATGGKLATQDTTKPTAGEKETASGDRHGKGSSSPGEVPLAASQKNGEDELSGKGDGAGARRKAGAPALSAEGALPRSSAAVKYRTKAKGDGAMPVKTLKNSVKKDRRDSDGSAVRRPKVRTSRDVDQQQPEQREPFPTTGVGSSSVPRQTPRPRDATTKRQVGSGLKSHTASDKKQTPSSRRRRGAPLTASTKSSTVPEGTMQRDATAAPAAAARSATGACGKKGASGGASSTLKRSARESSSSAQPGEKG